MSNLKSCNYQLIPEVWDVTSFRQTSQFIIGRFGVLATCPTRSHSATPSYSGGGRSTGTPAGGSIYKAGSAGLSTHIAPCWIIFNCPSQEVNRSVGLEWIWWCFDAAWSICKEQLIPPDAVTLATDLVTQRENGQRS